MRNRWLAMLLAGLLVAAACGRGDVDQLETQSVRTTPSTEEAEDPSGENEEPEDNDEQVAAPADETTPAPAAPPTGGQQNPQQQPPGNGAPAAGKINAPKIGDYVYKASGTDGQGRTQEGEYTSRVDEHNPIPTGTEVVSRVEGGQQGGQTTRMWWEENRILLTQMTFNTPQGSLECNFAQADGTPGLVMAKFPVRAETYPKQEWRDRQCSGSLELTYERQESIDAAGRSWDTWRVKYKMVIDVQFQMGPGPPTTVTITQDGTRWTSPQLGTDIRDEGEQEFKTPQGSGTGRSERVLQSHP